MPCAEVLDGQAVMFGWRGVRRSAELSALVLWQAEDDSVEYEAVNGGKEGRVGAETGRLRQPPLVVMPNVDARVGRFHAAMKQRSLNQWQQRAARTEVAFVHHRGGER